jgi:major membrane immunogen (membrane-anchored lipoprotein)
MPNRDELDRQWQAKIATTIAVLLAILGGCSSGIKTVVTDNTVKVDPGMTIAEVDREVGSPGEAVEFDALPNVFQQKVSGKDGRYRKWTKTNDRAKITVFAEIKDGKIVGSTYADVRVDSRK